MKATVHRLTAYCLLRPCHLKSAINVQPFCSSESDFPTLFRSESFASCLVEPRRSIASTSRYFFNAYWSDSSCRWVIHGTELAAGSICIIYSWKVDASGPEVYSRCSIAPVKLRRYRHTFTCSRDVVLKGRGSLKCRLQMCAVQRRSPACQHHVLMSTSAGSERTLTYSHLQWGLLRIHGRSRAVRYRWRSVSELESPYFSDWAFL